MSKSIQFVPTPTSAFQAHFGTPPGSPDLAAECKRWEELCAQLLAQRQGLVAELTKLQAERDGYIKALMRTECANYVCPNTKEELFANAIYEPTIPELIEELEKSHEG